MSEKIKKYFECYIPVTKCNLKCHYCYVAQANKFKGKILPLKYPVEHIAKALSEKRVGGTAFINLCGDGETMLLPEIVPLVEALLKQGHYISIVTNGTISKRIDEITKISEKYLKKLFIKFSFHYLEMERHKLMNVFFQNVNKIKKSGASFTVEITSNDELVPYIEKIKKVCTENIGALPHLSIARDDNSPTIARLSKYSEIQAKQIWGGFNSELFNFKLPMFGKRRNEFCYAGAWSYSLNIQTGDLASCYGCFPIQNIFENIDAPIKEYPVGKRCPYPHCFNNHSFLALGDIPVLKTNLPTYAEMRNRICQDGSEWLNKNTKDFFSSRLWESNCQYTEEEEKDFMKKIKRKKLKYKILSKLTFGKLHKKYKALSK